MVEVPHRCKTSHREPQAEDVSYEFTEAVQVGALFCSQCRLENYELYHSLAAHAFQQVRELRSTSKTQGAFATPACSSCKSVDEEPPS